MTQIIGSSIATIRDMDVVRTNYVADFIQPWPRSRLLGSNVGVDHLVMDEQIRFEWMVRFKGVQCKKIISGVTKDATGAALVGVEVTAYRTAADVANSYPADAADGFCVSGPGGEYAIGVPTSDPHYLVGYKGGATPVAGTTLDTLQGV